MMSGDPLPMVLAVEVQAVEVQVVNPIASAPPPEKVLAEMTDELHARMLQDGLTPEDQRKLFDDGINIVEMYDKIPDAEFSISGIDIKAGRQRVAQQESDERRRGYVRELGVKGVSAAGCALIQDSSLGEHEVKWWAHGSGGDLTSGELYRSLRTADRLVIGQEREEREERERVREREERKEREALKERAFRKRRKRCCWALLCIVVILVVLGEVPVLPAVFVILSLFILVVKGYEEPYEEPYEEALD